MDGQYWRPNHVNKRVVADIWLLTVSWTLTWEMMRIRNFYCFVYRQHIWLRKWEVIVGDMIDHVGIYGSRVAEGLSAFNVGLVLSRCHYLSILSERILSKCHCVVSLTLYCEIVDCEMLKQIVWSFHQTLAYRRPPSWIQWIWLRGWFHGFANPDSVSENLA